LAGELQTLIENKGIEQIFDALLIDETQDYIDTELLIFRKLAARLIVATDSRQSIYRATSSAQMLEGLVGQNVITLKYHYRTGLKICRVADGVVKDSANFAPMHGDCKYDEDVRPSSLQAFPSESLEAQFLQIVQRLPNQLDAYPGELIGVLFPKREQVAAFMDEIGRHNLGPEASRVRVDTMHGAKGLEFRAVHIGGVEALYRMGATQKRLIYTSILRGRTAVAIYHTGMLPGYLESAIAKVDAPRPNPTRNQLFSKTS
jgi:superfamily I DNA/RNA helicase